jgi:predicted component of type VI protein secretion system
MVIQVQLKDVRTGELQTLCFEQSPIRIGRNQLNNIAIDDHFVSEWHGIIRFDATGIYYYDLGSTNGTSLGGQRLPKNTVTPLAGSAQFTIWPFQISVVAQSSAPATGNTSTIAWGAPRSADGLPGVGAPAPAALDRASALHLGNRDQGPLRPDKPAPAFSPFAGEKTENAQARLMHLFETFGEALIGLKRGYEEFGAEVGVRPLGGGTPLHRARSSREVVEYLLDPAADAETRARELKAVFADMGIHHIALMEGLTQGIRALLESLDPSALDSRAGAGLFNRSKSKAEWQEYVERFATLISEDAALHAQIFGEKFARGYASVALAGSKPDPDDSEGSEEPWRRRG